MPLPSSKSSRSDALYGSSQFLLRDEQEEEIRGSVLANFDEFLAQLKAVEERNASRQGAGLFDEGEKPESPPKVKEDQPRAYGRRLPERQRLPEKQWTMKRSSLCRVNNELQVKGPPKYEGKSTQPKPIRRYGSSSAHSSPRISRRPSSAAAPIEPWEEIRCLNMDYVKSTPLSLFDKGESRSCFGSPRKLPKSQKHQLSRQEAVWSRARSVSAPGSTTRWRPNPALAQLKRPDPGDEYYRVRNFSVTRKGVFNLGDKFKRKNLDTDETSFAVDPAEAGASAMQPDHGLGSRRSSSAGESTSIMIPTYKVAVLGASGVGKTSLIKQFMSSEYTCGYDLPLDDEDGERIVHVMLNGEETELRIYEYPLEEVDEFYMAYRPEVCVVVYSVDSDETLKIAEEILMILWNRDPTSSIGAILVGNKTDLERGREIPREEGRKIAYISWCKFVETSSGLDVNVDELLVGIIAQASLNSKRKRKFQAVQKKSRFERGKKFIKRFFRLGRRTRSCENLFTL